MSLTNSRSIVGVTKKNFRRRVRQRSATRLQLLSWVEFVTEAKICELDHAKLLKKYNILGFEVTVHHMKLVTVADGVNNLTEVFAGSFFIQPRVVSATQVANTLLGKVLMEKDQIEQEQR